MRNLEKPLSELKIYLPHADKRNHAISAVPVGWHIEHTLLVILKITESVIKSNPDKYRWRFHLIRTLLFTVNKFPRGKGKAPEAVQPMQRENSDLDALFDQAQSAIQQLEMAHSNQNVVHPFFGMLNKKNAFILLDIHSRHHLAIVKDIVSSYQ